ncbi:pirin family protein [Pseudomonas sp. MBLB4123]|uniref:pirin family protein n=1 Tax=Pseudomonas sp. MBLB4123 TaxID=3451557 RepID=UPI003F74BAB2
MMTLTTLQQVAKGDYFRAQVLRGQEQQTSPFLGIDHAWMSAPTFAPHPHAGFSAVSYVFLDSETAIENRDSLGNHNLIQPGGLHWAAAGSGIVHEEIPAEAGKTVHSLQIFVACAPERRDSLPFALSLEPQDVPVAHLPGAKVRVVAGRYGQVVSPLLPPVEVTLLDILLDDGATLEIPVLPGQPTIVMPISGTLMVDGQVFEQEGLKLPLLLSQDSERVALLRAPRGTAKAMVFAGVPIPPTTPQ